MPFQNSQLSTYIQGQRLHCEDMLGQMVCTPSGSSTPDRATDMQTMDDGYGLSGRIRCTGDYRQDKGGYPNVVGEWALVCLNTRLPCPE